MIIHSSVLVAIALTEPEAERFVEILSQAESRYVSAGSWVELAAAATRGKLFTPEWLDRIRLNYELTIQPVTAEQAHVGQQAYSRFGMGTGHPARLNFGDCFAYALAKTTGEPLLFKGENFIHTDVTPALPA